jgi:hypothetical protein
MSIDLAGQNLTFEQAIVAITVEYPFLSEADVRGFFACTDDERALLVQTYRDSGKIPSASAWDTFLKICAVCVEIANVVMPLTGAIQAIFGLGQVKL